MKNYYTLDDAKRMDKLIFDLAFYEVTNGLLPVALDYDNMMSLNEQATKKFNEFKKLLRMNEYTLEELERDVVNRNSPMPPKKFNLDGDLGAKIDSFEKEEEERERQKEEIEKNPLAGSFFGSLLSDFGKSAGFGGSSLGSFSGLPSSPSGHFPDKFVIGNDLDDDEEDFDDEDDDEEDEDDGNVNLRWD